MKSTETYSVQRSMNNTRKLITSHYFVQYTFITERSCISQLSIRIMNHALRLASTVIKTQKNTIVYIDIQCKILMQKYCAYLFFYKKNIVRWLLLQYHILDLDTWYIAIHSTNSTTRPGGNSMLIKHITDSGKMLMNHPRGVFERKNVGAFTMH